MTFSKGLNLFYTVNSTNYYPEVNFFRLDPVFDKNTLIHIGGLITQYIV